MTDVIAWPPLDPDRPDACLMYPFGVQIVANFSSAMAAQSRGLAFLRGTRICFQYRDFDHTFHFETEEDLMVFMVAIA